MIDFHTHIPGRGGILSLTPDEMLRSSGLTGPLTVGIHPWDTASEETVARQLAIMPELLRDSRVVAVGETGIDTLRGASPEEQARVMALQVSLAGELGLPVVIHAVRSLDRIINLYDRLKPSTPWAIHGINGRAETIKRLAKRGIYMSAGPRTTHETTTLIPSTLLLIETDAEPNKTFSIDEVAERIAQARGTTSSAIKTLAATNLTRFFGNPATSISHPATTND